MSDVPKADTSTSRTFEQPGLKPADGLRPDVKLRLELLELVYRTEKDTRWLCQRAADLERCVTSGELPEAVQ